MEQELLSKIKPSDRLPKRTLAYFNNDPRLLDKLAREGIVPCYKVYDPSKSDFGFLYLPWELDSFIRKNWVYVQDGVSACNYDIVITKYTSDTTPDPIIVPKPLEKLHNLKCLPFDKVGYGSGVYFLCKGNDIVYVGESTCLIARISAHLHEKIKDFDSVYFLSIAPHARRKVEKAFIQHYNPKYNIQKENRGASDAEKQIVEKFWKNNGMDIEMKPNVDF